MVKFRYFDDYVGDTLIHSVIFDRFLIATYTLDNLTFLTYYIKIELIVKKKKDSDQKSSFVFTVE